MLPACCLSVNAATWVIIIQAIIYYILHFLLVSRSTSERPYWSINTEEMTSLLQALSTLLASRKTFMIGTVRIEDRWKDLIMGLFAKAPTKGTFRVGHSQLPLYMCNWKRYLLSQDKCLTPQPQRMSLWVWNYSYQYIWNTFTYSWHLQDKVLRQSQVQLRCIKETVLS